MQEISLLIGADLVPTYSNYTLFSSGNIDSLFGEKLCNILLSAKFKVFNLEAPLIDTHFPIEKYGPNLNIPTNCIIGLKRMQIDLLCLANNHIMDHGSQGLKNTIHTLNQAKISYTGVGKNLLEASVPFIITINQKRIGIYSCVEHEFSVATADRSGANPFDPLYSLDHINRLKQACDYVIVLYHGGKERYRYPSPYLQKVCRRLVDKGANLVICQHSHCIGCEEIYKDGTIVYGQGNFLFDYDNSDFSKTSLLITLDQDFNISYIPIMKYDNVVRLAEGDLGQEIIRNFRIRSNEILDNNFIENNYKQLCDIFSFFYIDALSVQKNIFFSLIKRTKFNHYFIKKKRILRIINYISCETHRELLLTSLQKYLKN